MATLTPSSQNILMSGRSTFGAPAACPTPSSAASWEPWLIRLVGALTIIISALQSGLLGRTTMGTLSQIRGLAGHLGIFAQQTDVNPSDVALLKAAMATGRFDYSAPRGQIAGFKTPSGQYIVNEGTTCMTAALEILSDTGDSTAVDKLIQNGVWTIGNSPDAPLPWPVGTGKISRSDSR